MVQVILYHNGTSYERCFFNIKICIKYAASTDQSFDFFSSSEMSERMQKKLSDPSIDILPLTLTGHDNDLDRKLSYEEALAKLRQLLTENAELKCWFLFFISFSTKGFS